jgi:hypothetical protein
MGEEDSIEASVVALESASGGPVHLYFPVEVEVLPLEGSATIAGPDLLDGLTDSLDSE